MATLNIGSVSYLNSLPLTHYLNAPVYRATPAQLTQDILSGQLDLALLPVVSILKHGLQAYPEAGLIGAENEVKSVGFFTKPHIASLEDIQSLYLDVESKTSQLLAKIILKYHFGRNLKSIQLTPLSECHKADAQLLIGDKALFFSEAGYVYHDLAKLWHAYSGTGFIFATWASKKPLPRSVIEDLAEAKTQGLNHLNEIADLHLEKNQRPLLLDYWKNNIVYDLTPSLKKGFQKFENLIRKENFFELGSELNTHYKYLTPSQPKNIFDLS